MLSKSLFQGINDKKVTFLDPYSSRKESLSPEDVMQIELSHGADVAMALDHVAHVNVDKKEVVEAMRRTHLWAERCKKTHDKLKDEMNSKQMLVGIAQGGIFKE